MTQAGILAAELQLFVADLARARAFYVDRLGFTLAFAHGDPPFYAQVTRGGARLNLRHAEGPVFDAAFKAREGDILSATVIVDAALFAEFEAAGVSFHQSLQTQAWGARTFIVADLDGNLIAFAGDPD